MRRAVTHLGDRQDMRWMREIRTREMRAREVAWATALVAGGALSVGCEGQPAGLDAPTLSVRAVADDAVHIGVDVAIDVDARGCESGVSSLTVRQDGQPVASAELDAERAPTRMLIPMDALTVSDWPGRVTLDATLICADGAMAADSMTVDVLAARDRAGDDTSDWPGYVFWPRPDGTHIFCDSGFLVHLRPPGDWLAGSDEIECGLDSELHVRPEHIVVLDGERATVLARDTLALEQDHRARAIAVGQHRLATLDPTTLELGSPVNLRVVALDDGQPLLDATLDGPGMDLVVAAPHIDSGSAVITALTMSVELDPLRGTLMRWRVDPESADEPTPTPVGTIATIAEGAALAGPTGWMPTPDRALLVERRDATAVTVALRDLEADAEIWRADLPAAPRSAPIVGGGRVLYIGSEALFVEPDGALAGRWTSADGAEIVGVAAHRAGGVILRLRGAGSAGWVTFLDAALDPVWRVPHPTAFGVAFGDDGQPWFLGRELLRLHSADAYRAQLQ